MRSRLLAVAAPAALLAATLAPPVVADSESAPVTADAAAQTGLAYPATETVDQIDVYHGAEVADPYRWLEGDVREEPAVADWVEAQNGVTFGYLDTLPGRDAIKTRMTELWNYEKFSLPYKEGGRYFFRRNDGLQNQAPLYVQTALDAEPEVLLDPNTWSDDGTVALATYAPSPDGRWLAYMIQDGGSDWRTIKVVNLETGEELEDKIEWVKFSGITWKRDGSGFWYSRFPEPEDGAEFQDLNFNHQIFFHAVGTDQSEDVLTYARPDNPELSMFAQATKDGNYVLVYMRSGTEAREEVALIDLNDPDAEPRILIPGFEHSYGLIGNDGSTLYMLTNESAPKNRIVAIDADNPAKENWREIIGEDEAVLQDAAIVGGAILTEYLQDVKTAVRIYSLAGEQQADLDLPGIGNAYGFEGEPDDAETFYGFTSFNRPPTIYRYDVATGESTLFKTAEVAFDPDDYVVEQVFYPSKDGTMIPMFITHKKGVERDGANPVMLYGYGGFNISIEPGFSPANLTWMEMGGVYVVANIRGGGEYGKAWHDGGRLDNKQNVFDDFIAAAEYLIAEDWTSPDHIAIRGGSNGGLLVGAVSNQRPELFAAGLPAVGVMDMLRFTQFTAGRYWVDDYGNPDESADDFAVLRAYSPYHNIPTGQGYPATLVTTADTDDRVVPGHSFKYTAALQAADTGDAPTLIRIETRAGHGAGKPTDKIIEGLSDQWAFAAHHTGLVIETAE